jgi:hypothetical protein
MTFTITFSAFRSPRYQQALQLAGSHSYTGSDLGTLRSLYDLLKEKGMYKVNGVDIDRKGFVRALDVAACCAKRSHAHYCTASAWGCRMIRSVELHLSYASNYWYTFGHFEGDIWIIHKEEILQRVMDEVKSRSISQCQHYNADYITRAISLLPDRINMKTTRLFRYTYGPRYIGDSDRTTPTGIEHVYEQRPYTIHEEVMIRLN